MKIQYQTTTNGKGLKEKVRRKPVIVHLSLETQSECQITEDLVTV